MYQKWENVHGYGLVKLSDIMIAKRHVGINYVYGIHAGKLKFILLVERNH